MPLIQDYAYLSLEPIQIEIPLRLEIERFSRLFEKRQARSISHLKKRVQHVRTATGLGQINAQSMAQGQPEKVLIKGSSLLRITTAIGRVVQFKNGGHVGFRAKKLATILH